MAEAFEENAFKARITTALDVVKTLLDVTKHAFLPQDSSHEYSDKFALAEWLTRSATAAIKNALFFSLEISQSHYNEILKASSKKQITLRWCLEDSCTFVKKEEREERSDSKNVTKTSLFGLFESFFITKITEWTWKLDVLYKLKAVIGNDKEITLFERLVSFEKVTRSEAPNRNTKTVRDSIDVNITYFLQSISNEFKIDRNSPKCRTPRVNPDIEEAFTQFENLASWSNTVRCAIEQNIFSLNSDSSVDVKAVTSDGIFVPVVPLFLRKAVGSSEDGDEVFLPVDWMPKLLQEQDRTLTLKFKDLAYGFPSADTSKVISVKEAQICIILSHCSDISREYFQSINFIEFMLLKQLTAAIGREVTEKDIRDFNRFHNRKLFSLAHSPKDFAYSVRFDSCSPEGSISILDESDDAIDSFVAKRLHGNAAMKFPLNASAKVTFFGERFLHGTVVSRFNTAVEAHLGLTSRLTLQARARQFSSFILLVGRIAGPDLFEPKHALYLANKDDLRIPLLLETFPTAKQFRDAISSLSPEQQRFAKAYRSLQLESTLFGVLVIQVKPQLEKLLNLPKMSLVKEIGLTQQIQDLLLKYQIPSDLLSYSGDSSSSTASKVASVQFNVDKILRTIQVEKDKEYEEIKENARLSQLEAQSSLLRSQIRSIDADHRNMSRASMNFSSNATSIRDGNVFGGLFGSIANKLGDLVSYKESSVLNNPLYSGSSSSDMNPLFIDGDFGGAIDGDGRGSSFGTVINLRNVDTNLSHEESGRMRGSKASTGEDRLIGGDASRSQSESLSGGESNSRPVQKTDSHVESSQSTPAQEHHPSDLEPIKADIKVEEEKLELVDCTKIPNELESRFDSLGSDDSVRPTIINTGEMWTKSEQKSLLSAPRSVSLGTDELTVEKNKAFDLLDALTKSGGLPVDYTSLHVIVAATHCFDKSVLNTLIKDNINPIESLERTSLIMAGTVQGENIDNLIREDKAKEISDHHSALTAFAFRR